jgi:hypothetical protein
LNHRFTLKKPVGQLFLSLVVFLCLPAFSSAQAAPPGKVMLLWTAPGDDGYTGQAAGYDIRYQSAAKGLLDTENEWATAHTVAGEPLPSPAGQTDSMLIGGLDYGASYCFCIRTYDQAGNYSLLSNSPVAVSGDYIECPYTPGDVNADGTVNIFDATYMIRFLYMEGDDPIPLNSGDTDASGFINLFDITRLMTFVYFPSDPLDCVYDK